MSFTFHRAAFERMVNDSPRSRAVMTAAVQAIRDDARANASAIAPHLTGAIAYEVDSDSEGMYGDVGYLRHHPGFVLWWAEVGTKNQPSQPHLRPAVKPGRL